MYNASILRQRSKSLSDVLIRLQIFTRSMGGGPRTFPGGINKWQWKRLHEKRAKEKEKRLLDQEKQLYESRIRSDIRSKLVDKSEIDSATTHNPMSPKEQIKALADRFMKEGAEDLWNEDDGVLKLDDQRSGRSIGSNKLVTENANPMIGAGGGFNYVSRRNYSTQSLRNPRRNERASRDVGLNLSGKTLDNGRNVSDFMKRRRFNKNDSSSSDEDSYDDGEVRDMRSKGSSASLGKYDIKKTKRIPLKEIEHEIDLDDQVEMIRKEITKSKLNESRVVEKEESILSEKRFDECGISPLTVKVLSEAGYDQMTRVQEATLAAYLDGHDVLVKSKTGTGKSAAFLIPAIETVLKAVASNTVQRVPPLYVLILCPTRELASQISAEAKALLKYHDGIGVHTLVGGTRFKDDQKRLEADPCQIIVATPGRLLDHVENKSGISVRLMGLKMLILDEADHLLDLGFRKDVEKIVDCLPRRRQSLLFSATMPKEVRRMSQLVLKRDHTYIDKVGLGCETPVKIKQSFLVAPHKSHFQIVHFLVKEHISENPDYKVIIFCSTGMVTSLLYNLLREMKMNVRELHSRKPQIYRTRISEEFKESKQVILVTSDVSARGMNYPDVTLVIQVGIPSDREQYIHRLGRTGREGKEGEGILLLAPWEEYFLRELKDLPLEECPLPQLDPDINNQIQNSMGKIDTSVKEAAYHSWLGYYNSMKETGRDKTTLVELANQFCESIGLERPPALYRKTALKMGLKDISGIRIRK